MVSTFKVVGFKSSVNLRLLPYTRGGIDLSPILAFTVLNVFTNTAAALPCELDGYESKTHTGKKWDKRVEVRGRADNCDWQIATEPELENSRDQEFSRETTGYISDEN